MDISRLAGIGNISRSEAKLIVAFSEPWEVEEGIVRATVHNLRETCKRRARLALNCECEHRVRV